MKAKKLSVLSILVAAVMLLTGCMADTMQVKVNEDGSGTTTLKIGYVKEAFDALLQMREEFSEDEEVEPFDLDSLDMFEANGKQYYGAVLTGEFSRPEDMLDCLYEAAMAMNEDEASSADSIHDSALEGLDIRLSPSGKGFLLDVDLGYTDTTEASEELQGNIRQITESSDEGGADAELQFSEMISENMYFCYEFNFPFPVRQVEGSTDGVTIDGNRLALNFMEMEGLDAAADYSSLERVLVFAIGDTNYTNVQKFTDVESDEWYYRAIQRLASGGLLTGMERVSLGHWIL